MKRKLQSIIMLILVVFINACSDVLTEKPKSMVVENFYNTPEEVQTATNAIYNSLRKNTRMSVYEATLECLSDYAYGRGSWTQIGEYRALNDANITRVSELWSSFYVGIRCANLVIQNSPSGNDEIDVYIAESKFLRAFIYFQLVRNWGDIPLRTEENMSELNVPKSPVKDIYEFILSDLLEAESVLPESRRESGRPDVYAAKTLLADVYLQLANYAEAAIKADEVIKSGRYTLVPVSGKEDFQDKVYGPDVIKTSEEIFYLKYSNIVTGEGNYMLWILNHQDTGGFPFGGAYAVHSDLTNPVYQGWDEADIRKQLWSNVEFGLGTNTLVSTKFIDRNAISKDGGANDDPVYGYPDVLLIFAESSAMASGSVSADALEALNQVRRRAYGYEPASPSTVDYQPKNYSSVDGFCDLVIKERGYEFQLEGKRWLELKRTGKYKEVIKAVKGIDVSEEALLWPIPLSEINYNTALDPKTDQNPGY